MGKPVVHFEILGGDGGKLQSFYKDLFEWNIDAANPMNYGMVDNGGQGINGGVAASQDGAAFVTVYIEVDDPQAYLDKAETLGGKTVMPVTEIPGMVTLAQFSDPQGNIIGIVKGQPQ